MEDKKGKVKGSNWEDSCENWKKFKKRLDSLPYAIQFPLESFVIGIGEMAEEDKQRSFSDKMLRAAKEIYQKTNRDIWKEMSDEFEKKRGERISKDTLKRYMTRATENGMHMEFFCEFFGMDKTEILYGIKKKKGYNEILGKEIHYPATSDLIETKKKELGEKIEELKKELKENQKEEEWDKLNEKLNRGKGEGLKELKKQKKEQKEELERNKKELREELGKLKKKQKEELEKREKEVEKELKYFKKEQEKELKNFKKEQEKEFKKRKEQLERDRKIKEKIKLERKMNDIIEIMELDQALNENYERLLRQQNDVKSRFNSLNVKTQKALILLAQGINVELEKEQEMNM